MTQKDNDFLKRLLATFRVEAEEHIRAISSGLIELEKASTAERRQELIETIFREAHSLKGAARSVNLTDFEALCQSLEGVFAELKSGEVSLSPGFYDLLHRAVDSLNQGLDAVGGERKTGETSAMIALARQLEEARRGALTPPPPPVETSPPFSPSAGKEEPSPIEDRPSVETVRLSVERLDALLLQAEELLAGKLSTAQQAAELRAAAAEFAAWKREWARLQPSLHAARPANGEPDPHLSRWAEFIEWNSQFVQSLEVRLNALARSAGRESRALGSMVDTLLDDMKHALMLPFSTLLEGFPKFVRDLAHDQDKEVELIIRGGEIEADRRILEEIKDPFLHLVRNCIDHGVEHPEERQRIGKPRCSTVTIAIAPLNGSRIEVLVADDGAGIDLAKVRLAALKLGLISLETGEKMGDEETLALIFHSGLSTSPLITDISGRGLGLAIVQEKVERLGGSVAIVDRSSIETTHGSGTTFRLLLPLTLATFRGVLVRANGGLFVLPTNHVERVMRVKREEISTIENRETIRYNGASLALAWLSEALGMAARRDPGEADEPAQIVVLAAGEKRIGFVVEEVLGEQEVLVKTLGKQLARVRNLAGTTSLGSGREALILNVPDLLKSAVKVAGRAARPAAAPEAAAKPKSILVVEDSITSRTLLKTILEAAGYAVSTAVDGADGFATLKTGDFDLVVSDVDMPRLNGFDLTAKIRADRQLADLPVALVTALETREDRERGAEVGANAYIVKSSFDQSNLLEVIRRLV